MRIELLESPGDRLRRWEDEHSGPTTFIAGAIGAGTSVVMIALAVISLRWPPAPGVYAAICAYMGLAGALYGRAAPRLRKAAMRRPWLIGAAPAVYLLPVVGLLSVTIVVADLSQIGLLSTS